jgi:hypothetical protein
MKPIDYRDETFEMLLARGLVSERLAVYRSFQQHGPGTTRQVAGKSGIDILSFRPRATELYQLGFLKLVEPDSKTPGGNEGIYRAYTYEEARAKFFVDKRAALNRGHQPELSL